MPFNFAISFNLNQKDRKGNHYIIAVVSHNDLDRLRYPTGFRIKRSQWSASRNLPKKSYPYYVTLIDSLKDVEEAIEYSYFKLTEGGKRPTLKALRYEIDLRLSRGKAYAENNFFNFLDRVIEGRESQKMLRRLSNGQKIPFSSGNIKNLKKFRNNLNAYKEYVGSDFSFSSIGYTFYESYELWLISERGYLPNTVGDFIKNLKVIMNLAFVDGLHTNIDYKRFSVAKVKVSNVYLNQNELEKMYRLDLSSSSMLDKARDFFLVMAWTGLRISDLKTLEPINVKKNNTGQDVIYQEQSKTLNEVSIPIHSVVRSIFRKYNFPQDKLPIISEQKINKAIKEICQRAGIVDVVEKVSGKGIRTSNKKYELVTCHTGRRSFATNLLLSCGSASRTMKCTGHKTMSSFESYIGFTVDENTTQLYKGAFFKS